MKKFEIAFTGASPLLMNSCRGANPLDPDVKIMKSYTSQRKKTDETHEKIMELQYKLSAYWRQDIGLYIPANAVEQCIKNGSKKNKLGKKMLTAIMLEEEYIPLETSAKGTIDEIYQNNDYVDVRNVVLDKKRVMKARPRFERWKLKFILLLDESLITKEQLIEALHVAGATVGLCDYRPEKGGKYGRFDVAIKQI